MTGTPNLKFFLLKLNLSTNGLVINLCHFLSRNLNLKIIFNNSLYRVEVGSLNNVTVVQWISMFSDFVATITIWAGLFKAGLR